MENDQKELEPTEEKIKKITIISVVLSIIVLFVSLTGISGLPHLQLPQISLPNLIETKPSPTPSETSQGQTTQPTSGNSQVVLSNCIMASNGAGGIRVNCAGHDSVQCTSDPPIGSGIQKDVTLTIDKNSCIVQYPNPQGSNTIYNFQLGTSPSTANTGTSSTTTPPTITIPKVIFPKITLPKVTIPSIQVPDTPSPVDAKPIINIPVLENKIHNLINVQRTQNSLTALSFDPQLNLIARGHSQDMARRNYFEHSTPEGLTYLDRYKQAEYTCEKRTNVSPNSYSIMEGGENIYQNNLYNSYETMNGVIVSHDWNDMDALASSTVQGWMHSTGHRENILTAILIVRELA